MAELICALQTTAHDGYHLEHGPRSLRGRGGTATAELVAALGLADKACTNCTFKPLMPQSQVVEAGGGGAVDLTASKFMLNGGRLHELKPDVARCDDVACTTLCDAARQHAVAGGASGRGRRIPQPPAARAGTGAAGRAVSARAAVARRGVGAATTHVNASSAAQVHAFVSRRLGPVVAADIVDAVCFGIYGASSTTLTARAFLPDLVDLEQQLMACFARVCVTPGRHGSILRGARALVRRRRDQAAAERGQFDAATLALADSLQCMCCMLGCARGDGGSAGVEPAARPWRAGRRAGCRSARPGSRAAFMCCAYSRCRAHTCMLMLPLRASSRELAA